MRIRQTLLMNLIILGIVGFSTAQEKVILTSDTSRVDTSKNILQATVKPEKIAVAVLDLDANGILPAEGRALSDRLRSEIFSTGVFEVMERAQMDRILAEMQFQLSGCTSDECAIEVGRLVGVQKMIAGSVSKLGDLFSVSLRLIDVETSKIEAAAVFDIEGSLATVLTQAIPHVARKISGLPVSEPNFRKSTKFRIMTAPSGARIFLDGLYQGLSPLEIEVTTGHVYYLKAVKNGYQEWEDSYKAVEGQILDVNIALSPLQSKPETIVKYEKPQRAYNQGFKIRYADMRVTDKLNQHMALLNEQIDRQKLFRRSLAGEGIIFRNIVRFNGIEVYNTHQINPFLAYEFGLGCYRAEFDRWISDIISGDAKSPSSISLATWSPEITLILRFATIRFPIFYPFIDLGAGYNFLIQTAFEDERSLGGPVYHGWGMIYGLGVELKPFKFIGFSLEWMRRNGDLSLLDFDKVSTNFKDAGLRKIDISGVNFGLALTLYY